MKTPKEAIAELLRRPARAAALVETQTEADEGDRAMVGNLKRELAEHPSRGLTPARLYQVLEAAEAGDLRQQHALFADMEEKDIVLAAALMRRKNATAGLEWQIVPPDNATLHERKAADHAAEVFSGLDVQSLVMDLGDAIGHGWVQLELPWTRDGAHRVPEQPTWREHGWFMTAPERPREIRLRDGTAEGEALWPLGWVSHRHRARSGYPARVGLHRALVWPYLFRNYALGDLAELLEILGIPARLGKYPRGATEKEKATLLRAVTSIGHSAAGIIPESMAIEYLEAAKADGDAHMVMIDWCDRSTTKAILGGTLTIGTDGSGTYALGRIHQESLDSLIASDARQYAETIRRDVLWPMVALNFGITDPRRAPRWYLDLDQVGDFKALAETLPTFVETGMKIPMWWFYEKSGIPRAAPGEPICQPVRSRAPQAVRQAPAPARAAASRSPAPVVERVADPMSAHAFGLSLLPYPIAVPADDGAPQPYKGKPS